jgi:hypothetical protein
LRWKGGFSSVDEEIWTPYVVEIGGKAMKVNGFLGNPSNSAMSMTGEV